MKRSCSFRAVLFLAFLLTGCITVFVPVDTPTPPPTTIILPTLPPPTQTLVSSPTSVPFAPLCSVDPLASACKPPTVSTLSKSCIKKIPYSLVALPPGSTFEIVEPGMTCKDEGLRGGQQQISCTGQQLFSYELKVCDSSCYAAHLEADTTQCQDGYGYSSAAGCCWPTSALEAGCVLYKVDIGACN